MLGFWGPKSVRGVQSGDLLVFRVGSLQSQTTKALTTAMSNWFRRMQWPSAGLLICWYDNGSSTPPDQLCLLLRLLSCRRVYLTFCGSHLRRLWRDIAYRNMPLQHSSTNGKIAQNSKKYDGQWPLLLNIRVVFYQIDGSTSYYTFTHISYWLKQCCISVTSLPIFVGYVLYDWPHVTQGEWVCEFLIKQQARVKQNGIGACLVSHRMIDVAVWKAKRWRGWSSFLLTRSSSTK